MAKFLYGQLIQSKLAKDLNINNTPGIDVNTDPLLTEQYIKNNLNLLANNCINPIMDAFPNEIGITSGYRCKALNESIKPTPGVKNSLHIKGQAVDLISIKRPSSEIWNWCRENLPEYYQIIWEYPELGDFTVGKPVSWIHISYKENENLKINSVASVREDIHVNIQDEKTYKKGSYTHNIEFADETLI